jgi:ornithine cyclodeaminase/alanine dehydrogenase-like protein (mu-crystallin family)
MSIVPSRNALYITGSDVPRLLPMKEAIDCVQGAFEARAGGQAADHPRYRMAMPEEGAPEAMMHVLGGTISARGVAGTKTYLTRRGAAQFVVLLFSIEGPLLAVIEANLMGQIRTAAASGVATRFLAREDARRLAVIGAGFQARGQVEAICAVRPIEQVTVVSRSRESAERFCASMRFSVDAELTVADSAEAALEGADVVVTATTSRSPVLLGRWLRGGMHVNAMGSNAPQRRELDEEAVARADLVVADDLEQARAEAGDLLSVEGFHWDRVVSLADVVRGKVGRTSPGEVTLFESQGLATEDLAVAHHVYEAAKAAGIGTRLPLSES